MVKIMHTLFILLPLLFAGALRAELTALQLGPDTLQHRVGGSDAIGGLGDWLLSDGELCATISDVGHESGLSVTGGWLVDLGHCGRGDDQFLYTHLLPAMEREKILPVTRIEAQQEPGRSAIVVHRSNGVLQATIRYWLSDKLPGQLNIDTELQRVGEGDEVSMVGQLWLHPHRVLTPFTLSTRDPALSVGYRYPSFDRDDGLDAINAMMAADLTIFVSGDSAGPGISYGVQSLSGVLVDDEGEEHELMQFTLVETDYTNQAWLSRPLWLGGGGTPGRLELLQSLFMDIEPGETMRLRQRILVSDRAEVASITDRIYQGSWLSGEVDTVEARIAVFDGEGNPLSEARPAADGSFRLRLPAGLETCELRLRTPWSQEQRIEVELSGEDQRLARFDTGAPGTLRLPRGKTMRLVFVGRGETADPQFHDDMSGYRLGSQPVPVSPQTNSLSLVGNAGDPISVQLTPGQYRVYATRGPEYTITSQDIQLAAGETVVLALADPKKAVDVGGWVSTDFHVHSGFSFDSAISPQQRIRSFVAQGADVLIATEHDNVVDLSAVAEETGLDHRLTVIAGTELSGMARAGQAPRTIGHLNVYPLVPDNREFAGGLPMHEGKRLHRVLGEIRADHPAALVQLNHPRTVNAPDTDLAFFDHLSIGERFDPGLSLGNIQNRSLIEADSATGIRDLDFDILELANGASLEQYQLVRADWLSLILQGEYRPVVASSDSHHLRDPVALPRTYVAYDGPIQAPIDTGELLNKVRAGRMFGSSGPIPHVSLHSDNGEQAGIGETIAGADFHLRLSAEAAPWIDISEAWVYLNGVVLKGGPIGRGEVWDIPLELEQDSFVFVEFYGEPGEAYAAVAPGYIPMAFTNPIWIDADGDGRWQAPGLASLPMAISKPASLPSKMPDDI